MEDVDFRAIIDRLAADGVTQTELAERVGCSQENLSRIKAGQEPRFRLGMKILREYEAEVGPVV
jgi:predicted transcriptional regulator